MNTGTTTEQPLLLKDPQLLESYRRDESFVRPVRPHSVVRIADTAELQALVEWANRTRTPLVPVSSAAPHYHGDTVPSVGGAVIVDLSGMKRIVRVDRRNRIAMIEPGVTFDELRPALAKEGLSPLAPLLPRRGKSVLTSFLERTPITAPRFHWEPQDPLQCVEVVYGTGEVMRTGSAAIPSSLEAQWQLGKAQVRGTGPSQVDFTRLLQGAQGTMGIVTWGTIKCRPLPKLAKSFLVACEDLAPLVELAYAITFRKLGEDLFLLNRANLAAMLATTTKEIDELRATLPAWILLLGIDAAGVLPDEKIAYQEAECIELAQAEGLALQTTVATVGAQRVANLLTAAAPATDWRTRRHGAGTSIFFLTTLDKACGFVDGFRAIASDRLYPVSDIGVYIQPTVQGGNCHVQFDLGYSRTSRHEAENAAWLVEQGAASLAKEGAFFSRPYGSWARIAYSGDAQIVVAQRKLKQIFDPNGILNPGKLCF